MPAAVTVSETALLFRRVERCRHDAARAGRRTCDNAAHDRVDLADADGVGRRLDGRLPHVPARAVRVELLRVAARHARERPLRILDAAHNRLLHDLPVLQHRLQDLAARALPVVHLALEHDLMDRHMLRFSERHELPDRIEIRLNHLILLSLRSPEWQRPSRPRRPRSTPRRHRRRAARRARGSSWPSRRGSGARRA